MAGGGCTVTRLCVEQHLSILHFAFCLASPATHVHMPGGQPRVVLWTARRRQALILHDPTLHNKLCQMN